MKTFKIHTLGCKVNQYETQLMREQLLCAGLREIDSNIPADIYIINTCTVTGDADRECRRFIRRSIKENPDATIIAAGCYVEKDADIIKAIDEKIIILTNKEKKDVLKKMVPGTTFFKKSCLAPFFITHFKNRTKAFVKVQDGCDNYCSYCKVPYVRGAPKSRGKSEIIQEVKALLKNNYKELVITGICLGAYGKDLKENICLKDIIGAISELEGDFRIRLSSIEMQDITGDLMEIIKTRNNICNHLHISLQSGDDSTLRVMNRKYISAEFIKKIKHIKKIIPGIAISTDVIVGFPSEDESAFKNTLKCIKKIKPMRTHIFSYSPREGTAAYNLKQNTDKKDIAKRYAALKRMTDKLAQSYHNKTKNIRQRVLVENARDKKSGKLCGYTDTYVKLAFDGPDAWMATLVYI